MQSRESSNGPYPRPISAASFHRQDAPSPAGKTRARASSSANERRVSGVPSNRTPRHCAATSFGASPSHGEKVNTRRGWAVKSQKLAIQCRAKVYLMAVQDELDMYPEMHSRTRHWVPLEEAFVLSKHAWMHDALQVRLTSITRGSWAAPLRKA